MPASFTFTWDKGDLRRFAGQGIEKAVTRAVSKGGRDALRAMKTASQRAVRFRKRIRVARINRSLPTDSTHARELDEMEWVMYVSDEPIRLIDYPHGQTKRGVSVSVNFGKRKLVAGAFIATLKSGHVGIFRRTGKARFPIQELLSTRVSDVFGDATLIPLVFERASAEFTKTFDRVLPLELDKI